MTVHVLSEYESRSLRLEPDVVDVLVSSHSKHLALAPLADRDHWLVTAKHYVGAIRAGEDSFRAMTVYCRPAG
jgi:hypothetical protein